MSKQDNLNDQAFTMVVQKHQLDSAQAHLGRLSAEIDIVLSEQETNLDALEALITQAEASVEHSQIIFDVEDELLYESTLLIDDRDIDLPQTEIGALDRIEIAGDTDWVQYFNHIEAYATRHQIEYKKDPFQDLMCPSQKIELEKRIKEDFCLKGANCDKYDYMIAGTCGLIGGLIDVLFVGLPGQGALTKFTDEMTDNAVQKFAKLNGWKGPNEGKDPTNSAIGFLERNFKVNYDHRHGVDVGGRFDMSTKNHHIKSLGHSPDLVGLFFSILDQFNNTAHFVGIFDKFNESGVKVGEYSKLIAIDTSDNESFKLVGSNFVSKLYCGFINWLGHLFSDVAGSSGAQGRGSGIPIPFYSLLQFLNFGEFGKHKQSFAKIAVQVFEQGYDFRHGMALAIPVLVTELLTRAMWAVKQRFYHDKAWAECIPTANNPELRRMLLVGHGSLCLVDTTDAALRSGGNMVQFMLRSNIIAWVRFGTLALKDLKAWCREGDLDIEAVDAYLDAEYKRMLDA
ncbi:hypothetical protein [Litchfieldella xinjiangensis]|uniref:hypothetical protein n=1 Tax=Litchfieldella xinjiangensis TaxID=1166948 RepID=UPI0005BC74B2|nr:hypothetical protein [Halomonas xinjiangensis]